jgi:hypothetical protein
MHQEFGTVYQFVFHHVLPTWINNLNFTHKHSFITEVFLINQSLYAPLPSKSKEQVIVKIEN